MSLGEKLLIIAAAIVIWVAANYLLWEIVQAL